MPRGLSIPEEVKQETLWRLQRHARKKYIGRYGVVEVLANFKGSYLYIDWTDTGWARTWENWQRWGFKRKPKADRLCRLKYTGNPNRWEFQIYKYSDNWYDVEGEFPFGYGTVERCFDAAASLYITYTFP